MSNDDPAAYIVGNVPQDVKLLLSEPLKIFSMRGPHVKSPLFGDSIVSRMVVTEASINPKNEEPLKKEGRVVCEIRVEEGE